MEVPLSYLSVNRIVKCMRILGLYPIESGSPRIHRIWHKIYRHLTILLVVIYTMQLLLKVYSVRNDVDKVIANALVFLTYSGYVCKLIIIEAKYKEIDQILDVMKGPVFNQGEVEHRKPLLKAVKRAMTYGPFFNYVAVVVWILTHLQILVSHIQGKSIEFAIWLPFDYNLDPKFYLAVFYNWIVTTATAFGNSTYDILIVCLFEQCTTQISIVRLNLKFIVERSKDEQIKTTHTFDGIFQRRIKNIIFHHQEIVRMSERLNEIFGIYLLYQFFIEGWCLCMLAYGITKVELAYVELITLVIFLVTVLTETFLYCYFGNDVTLESEKLVTSLYEMDWLPLSVKHRRILLIFMEICKQPIIPMAGKIIPLSNGTFISVLRGAYSCYAFLENSQNNA